MLCNHFTLVHVARCIHHRCAESRISELYSQQKHQLCINVEARPVQTIVVSCEPAENYVSIREGTFRARKNSVDLFPSVAGKKILNVACNPDDRVIIFTMEDDATLECEMFGSRANIVLWRHDTNADPPSEIVVDAFLKKKELTGSRRPAKNGRETSSYQRFMSDEKLFFETLKEGKGENIVSSLKKMMPTLGSLLVKEILLRSNLDSTAMPSLISDREIRRVYAETQKLIVELTAPVGPGQARIYYEERSPVSMSLIPLRSMEHYAHESFPDVVSAVQRFVGAARDSSTFSAERDRVSSWLDKEKKKAEGTLGKLLAEHSEHDRAGEYEFHGKLIMAHIHELRKGIQKATLVNTIYPGDYPGTVSVRLDPSLNPAGNAEKYFEKAKKARVAAEDSLERSKMLERRIETLRTLGEELSDVQSNESLKEFHRTHKTLLQETGYMTEKEKESLPPFRIFIVAGGFQVLAGKSSENNDMLTTKYAKPNDLWFHCRGASGSHVVLKVNSGEGEPSKTAIHQAASIAAYYSKMKKASSVPVAMTEKKFVRKMKGAPAGTVVLEREKVIFVQPKLPPSSHQS